jgi:hypothetical protein
MQIGKPFTPTSAEEIRVFLGISLCMSITIKPSYRDYWSNEPELHDSFVLQLMPVKRFSFLLSHIHLNDNSVYPGRDSLNYDKLYKIRQLLDSLSQPFSECYKPHCKVAVDEAMVKFKGRFCLKQYMGEKSIKRGYKIWMLCDESCYNLKFHVFMKKIGNKAETGLRQRVVLDLMSGMEGENHIVFGDNYFSSHELFKKIERKEYLCMWHSKSNQGRSSKAKGRKKYKQRRL